ncbi:endonuclease MutS2 [Dellaglioa carnosa]|uniref:endonuclease MutS2 n=1 Tax=Dellaglioa carnosa TaxID=2995136 RepID=UPI0022A82960|nr:endonuclease MutS2 [Dellaglioa carnosa]MCZ2492935.1 endonuclease MutS2 [Dellaglioa carnosa]
MNEKGLNTLEYQKVKQQIQAFISTESGQEEVNGLKPMIDLEKIQKDLDETQDAVKILRLRGGIPLPQLVNVKPHMKRLDMGASLNGKELAAVGRVLRTTNEIKLFFKDLADSEIELVRLFDWIDKLENLPDISRRLNQSIENDGHITDEASPVLHNIRQNILRSESAIRAKLQEFTRGKSAKYLSEALITIRNERYVIPVKAEYRGQFGGAVHDQSATGQTLFIEPQAIVEMNNRLREQQLAQADEERRILAELSELIAPFTAEILENAYILGHFDFVNAKAQYASSIKATEPTISIENDIFLRQARHPLLDSKKVVANDIMLGKDYQAIVVTGPNTGGKTITLKTLGLIQMMGQSGLNIPTSEGSRIGIFEDIFADIGDEQSIEQSLSTFSAHMTNIVSILANINDRSLVLFDELGAGTDPQEGAALAISILDAVGAKGSYTVATTHYPELKAYGFNRAGTINASMEFDSVTLQPTYRLLIGIPGRSNAFDISRKIGLDSAIVDQAQSLTDQDSQDLNEMISDLMSKRKEAEDEALALQIQLTDATKLHDDLAKEYGDFVTQRESMTNKAKEKANDIVADAEIDADKIIKKIRQMQITQGQAIKEHELIDAKSQLSQMHQPTDALKKNKVLQRAKSKQEFRVNDDVLVKTYGQQGVLVKKMSKTEWEVQLGILKMKISEDDLQKVHVESDKKDRTVFKNAASTSTSTSLDLRGQRYDDAMSQVDQYIDSVLLAGYASVTIVHGKGTGALRTGITDYLKANRHVKSFEFAAPNAGGNGATIVHFK